MSESKTHWKKLQNPDYFGSWSIPEGQDLILTISHVQVEDVTGASGRKEKLPVCHFKENMKPLVLNVTNSKQITVIHGTPYVEEWRGKQIQLFQSTTKMAGEEVECVRVRPFVPNKAKPAFTPDLDRWSAAIESIAKGDSTIEAVKKHFTLSEEHEAQMKEEIEIYLHDNEMEEADA